MAHESTRRRYGLPSRLFLYTLDQIADMLALPNIDKLVFRIGVDPGIPPRTMLAARNITPHAAESEWRIEEMELIRWMKVTGTLPMTR
jgi:hypothetical protein